MDKTINLQFSLDENNFRLLENDDYCSIAEIDFLHMGDNRNQCSISKECVEKSLQSFYNKPLLCILDNKYMPSLSTDFVEHAWSEEDRKRFVAFGTIPESSTFRFVERENGRTYFSANVVIWKHYFPIVMNILKARGGNVKVSIELCVEEGLQDDLTGMLYIDKFKLLSCVLLGEGILEGIEGSHMEIKRFSLDDYKEANKHYLSFAQRNTLYEVPNEVRDSIKRGLLTYKAMGRGCSNEDIIIAKNVLNNKYIDRNEMKTIAQRLEDNIEEDSHLTFKMLGGKEMKDWIESMGESITFAKSEYGKGEAIKVDKSKEAMSETSWGSVDKTSLRNKVLAAKNYKTLVKSVYALVEDGWEESPSTKLKYPIMEIKDGKAVYNRYGLASALAYAENNNETAVITKVKSLYKKLDIENDDEGGEKKMAKELDKDEEVVENKLDKDNKDVEEIKDDAEAQEDDVKEEKDEVKNAAEEPEEEIKNACEGEEVENACECGDEVKNSEGEEDKKEEDKEEEKPEEKKEAEVKNAIEEDDKGEEGLKDDVDSDKDYWKKKANALEIKNAEMAEELKKYKRAEEERQMSAEIDKFAHCMSEEEATELRNSIKEMSMDEMKEKINSKIAAFALEMKNKQEEAKEEKYSINPLFEIETVKFSKEEIKSLESIISNSNVDIAGK